MTVFNDHARLESWEECIGVCHGIEMDNGILVAQIGKISLILPSELAPKLREFQGQNIGLLKTDQDYRFRVIEMKQMAGEAFVDPDNAMTGDVNVMARDCRGKRINLETAQCPDACSALDEEIEARAIGSRNQPETDPENEREAVNAK